MTGPTWARVGRSAAIVHGDLFRFCLLPGNWCPVDFCTSINSQDEVMDSGRKSAGIVYSFMHGNGVNKTIVRRSAGKRWSNQ